MLVDSCSTTVTGLSGYTTLSGFFEEKKMGSNLNEHSVKVILPNQIGYERIAMASSASLARMFDFPPQRIEDLKTVVSEAAINAMQHGNKGRPDALVTVDFEYKEDAIYIQVTDEGGGVKELLPKPDIDRIIEELDPPIGFGVFLIQELADEVEFNLDKDKGHCLKMVVKKNREKK
jgi:serine/threonine-protein kinase RsbW